MRSRLLAHLAGLPIGNGLASVRCLTTSGTCPRLISTIHPPSASLLSRLPVELVCLLFVGFRFDILAHFAVNAGAAVIAVRLLRRE